MTIKQALEKSYEDLAPLSARWKKEFRMHFYTLKMLERCLGGFTGKKILDVGCGLGILSQALRNLGAEAEGADKHILVEWGLQGIEAAWQKLGLKVTIGDFFTMDFAGGYDAIVSENMLEHLPYTQRDFFTKIYTALCPDGALVLSTPNLASFLKRARMFFGKSPYWDFEDFFLRKQPFGHFREFTAEELRKMAELSDFEVLDICARNIYFKRKWLVDWHKLPQTLNWLLSSIFSSGRDNLYLIARKNVRDKRI